VGSAKTGIYALEKADLFNLLCIPPHVLDGDIEPGLITAAATYCEERRAMLLIDPPSGWMNKDAAKAGIIDQVLELLAKMQQFSSRV
jgi:hypothetical protein